MAINSNVFIHDADRAAMNALRSVPGFEQVANLFMRYWSEKAMRIENMATKVRISSEQLSHYFDMLPPICDKLGIDIPELYLELDPVANAYAMGNEKSSITITSGLLETFPDELVPTVIAHECGHIACHHMLYTTMAYWVAEGALRLAFSIIPGFLSEAALMGIEGAFSYWSRCSEFSADRAAILCDGTPEKMFEVSMRLAGFDKDIGLEANFDAFLEQAREYRSLISDDGANKAMELYMHFGFSHPVNSVRALEAYEWAASEDFIKAKAYFESVKREELPAEFPISWNEKHFLGRNFEEVRSELAAFGFGNVLLRPDPEKKLFAKEGCVTSVLIEGSSRYAPGDWYEADSEVVVAYYQLMNEEEIAALHVGEAKLPCALKGYIGRHYEAVRDELASLGFADIEIDEVKDVIKDKDRKLGKVAGIMIGKSPVYAKGEWVDTSLRVEIAYHSMK